MHASTAPTLRGFLLFAGLAILALWLSAWSFGLIHDAQAAGGALAVVPAFGVADYSLRRAKALPAAASTATSTDGIDLRLDRHFLAEVEFRLTAPALTTTILPDTKTCTYSIEMDDDSGFGSPTVLYPSVLVQTGAGGAGAAAAEYRFRVPAEVQRYIRAKATFGADTTTGAALSFVLEPMF